MEQGRRILSSGSEDEHVYQQIAQSLLRIPRTGEAVEFIEQDWIARKGPSLERLSMLACAKGCLAEYQEAVEVWRQLLGLSEGCTDEDVLNSVPIGCRALVDCLVSAGEIARGKEVTRQGWERCGGIGGAPLEKWAGDLDWLTVYCQAGLDLGGIAERLRDRHARLVPQDPRHEAMLFAVKAWVQDIDEFMEDWLRWIRSHAGAKSLPGSDFVRLAIRSAFRMKKRPSDFNRFARATWNAVEESSLQDVVASPDL